MYSFLVLFLLLNKKVFQDMLKLLHQLVKTMSELSYKYMKKYKQVIWLGCLLIFTQTLQAQYTFIGSATLEPSNPSNCIQITPLASDAQGWVYSDTRFDLSNNIDVNFDLYLGNDDTGADGVVFVLHNDTRGYNARGCKGVNLGYGGNGCLGTYLSPSFGVEIDTHSNLPRNDPAADHVAFIQNGIVNHPAVFDGYAFPTNIEDNTTHNFRFTWTAATQTISIYWEGGATPILQRVVDLPTLLGTNNPYWGFTGATGTNINQQYFCSALGINLNPAPLPVSLVSFWGKQVQQKVELQWLTASETNNAYFMIERASGDLDFRAIGKINGSGNSQQTRQYRVFDEIPQKGINYYRLKQVDTDSTINYSKIIQVNFDTGEKPFFKAFPNPAQSGKEIYIQSGNFIHHDYQLIIQDLRGKILIHQRLKANAVENLTFNLPAGVYLLTARDAQHIFTQKWIVE